MHMNFLVLQYYTKDRVDHMHLLFILIREIRIKPPAGYRYWSCLLRHCQVDSKNPREQNLNVHKHLWSYTTSEKDWLVRYLVRWA